jgi:hypothetical protein
LWAVTVEDDDDDDDDDGDYDYDDKQFVDVCHLCVNAL